MVTVSPHRRSPQPGRTGSAGLTSGLRAAAPRPAGRRLHLPGGRALADQLAIQGLDEPARFGDHRVGVPQDLSQAVCFVCGHRRRAGVGCRPCRTSNLDAGQKRPEPLVSTRRVDLYLGVTVQGRRALAGLRHESKAGPAPRASSRGSPLPPRGPSLLANELRALLANVPKGLLQELQPSRELGEFHEQLVGPAGQDAEKVGAALHRSR
jgi:hypothetical protein